MQNHKGACDMTYKIYVDGQEGTTGLLIQERLAARSRALDNIEVLKIPLDKRKDDAERANYLNSADIVFLCLPDAAAVEAVNMIKNANVRIIDASTAHRTAEGWAYGLPELSAKHRADIQNAKRVSVPGCYATGFNMTVYPLVQAGLLNPSCPVSCHAISGYSGGGRRTIEAYEAPNRDAAYDSPQFYKMNLAHKHLPEMQRVPGLDMPPLFTPIITDVYKGMTVAVPLHIKQMSLKFTLSELRRFYADYYADSQFIHVLPEPENAGLFNGDFLVSTQFTGVNDLEILVAGNDDQAVVFTRFDNLGKGSSGAAVQCMNIMLGADESLGLEN